MICLGCEKHISEYTEHLMPEPDEFWHPNCWVRVFWHLEDGGGNPRPMTTAEKIAYAEKNVRRCNGELRGTDASPCLECKGTGDCVACDGTGQDGGNIGGGACEWCAGIAACPACNGSGIDSDDGE